MSCYQNYVTIDRSIPSRSGLYATDLPGVELSLLDLLTKEDQADADEFWEMIYKKAWDNFVSDLTHALQDKFYVDSKLISRETSQFKTTSSGSGLSGVTIKFQLPRYARLHIVSVDIWGIDAYASPEFEIKVFDQDADGDELASITEETTEGSNTIFIDQDFNTSKVLVAFDADVYSLRQTENKRYSNSPYISFNCDECYFDCGGYGGRITQYNGGGLNVKYNVVCSVEKYACENINLFKQAFFYRIGLELVYERILGNRINRFMTMTLERQDELKEFYNTQYMANLERSVRNTGMDEDPYCFTCKEMITKRKELP
jgi:hypothetical protein